MKTLSPLDLEVLKKELSNPELQVYTVVELATKDLESNQVERALLRLRVDADKFRCYDTEINRILKNYFN